MSGFLYFGFVVKYFFVFLIVGFALIALRKDIDSEISQNLGKILVVLGVLGGIYGVPYWYQEIRHELAARSHFKHVCKYTVMQLPATPVSSDGLVWLEPNSARGLFFGGHDSPEDFVNPGIGRYQRIEVQGKTNEDFTAVFWDPPHDRPNMPKTKKLPLPSPTQAYAVTTSPATTALDKKYGIEGVDTYITDLHKNEIIAHKRIYGRYAKGVYPGASLPRFVCPDDALKDAECQTGGCSVVPFVLKAVKPTVPDDLSRSFHVYRGMPNKRKLYCEQQINIGPGIKPDDIEWWATGTEGWEYLNMRFKGSNEFFYCDNFFWDGAKMWGDLHFHDGTKFSSYLINAYWKKNQPKGPESLDKVLTIKKEVLHIPGPAPSAPVAVPGKF